MMTMVTMATMMTMTTMMTIVFVRKYRSKLEVVWSYITSNLLV